MENMKREESAITLEEIKSKNGDNDEAAIENRVATYHFGLKRYRAQENGDCGYDAAVLPKWFNEEMFERAKILARKHFMALMFTHLCGLYLLVFMKPIFNVLASTGQSKNISCLFRRYFRTLKHVKIWYEGNVWDFHDDASKSIAMVRAMHKQVAHKCNKNNSREEVFISQRDMVYTQFAFIGLLILYPRRFGFTLNEYDLKCIVHFWACIGYLLGIDDKCNLFASENLLEIRSICDRILDDMKCYASEEQSEEMKRMADGIIIGVNTFVPCLQRVSKLSLSLND
ncbi:hypothetical protein B4U79_01147 [Dinothrombium tinctorium]|uniref:ER-bound oxygenase mpaB/mpaB'/Rubber oxygenase catalytic domain-containing protein n=1 Tax=Dinothrombium tinctorium TaxID=1965070 RepID=A0A443RIT5_9ACAR|nr:hypothetical protein B4U79_01147 [Dinothrombium tinctorium]